VKHADVISRLEGALSKWIVARDHDDLAAELLQHWPADSMKVIDEVTDSRFIQRLIDQKKPEPVIEYSGLAVHGGPLANNPTVSHFANHFQQALQTDCIHIFADHEELVVEMKTKSHSFTERLKLPFKVGLASDRGKRSAAEWALWAIVKNLRQR
jgi:hypothetical protein